MSDTEHEDEWTLWWEARVAAMESVLGKSDDIVGHGVIPFHAGAEMGGAADIVYFRNHLEGVVAVTSELIGCDDQLPNEQGNYELAICTRDDDEWGPNIISQIAHYTLEAALNPGETMILGPQLPMAQPSQHFSFAISDDSGYVIATPVCSCVSASPQMNWHIAVQEISRVSNGRSRMPAFTRLLTCSGSQSSSP